MTEFFYRSGPNEFGPLDAVELKDLAGSGRLKPGDEVRRGRTGKWIPAESVQGLFGAPKRRADLAINEMDVIAELPVTAAVEAPCPPVAEQETSADAGLTAEKVIITRMIEREPESASSPIVPEGSHRQFPGFTIAVILACYFTALIAVAAGIWRLTGAANELQQILGTLLLGLAIVSLAAGCALGLLRRTLTNLSHLGRNVLPDTGFRGKKR
jgi:hypothetical protein